MNKRRKGSNPDSALYTAILHLNTPQECYRFFSDLCADTELGAMEQRFEVARMLSQGMSYNEIMERVGASSATISRVSRCLITGTGAYEHIFAQLEDEED